MSPRRNSSACWAKSRSAFLKLTLAWDTLPCTSERVWAWFTSGSTSARTSPARTVAPSRTFRPTMRPETVDFTSTLVRGSTTPTSRTLTWRSSAWTFPSRKGVVASAFLPLPSLPFRVRNMPAARATPATDAMIHRFFMEPPDGKDAGRAGMLDELRGRVWGRLAGGWAGLRPLGGQGRRRPLGGRPMPRLQLATSKWQLSTYRTLKPFR